MSVAIPKRIAVVSLWAEDVPATAHFYRDVLGLRLLPHDSHHSERVHFDLDGIYLTLLQGKPIPAQNAEPFPLIAFAVDDLDSAIDRLQAHQVELPRDVAEDADSRWVLFHDPAGNLIELVQFKSS